MANAANKSYLCKNFNGKMKFDLKKELSSRILVLDGGMGTMIQQYGLTEEDYRGNFVPNSEVQQKGNNDLLCITRSDVISDIHNKYLEAGADIIETCSFNSQRISMADYKMEGHIHELNFAAAQLARKAADN